jgi:peptidoglycan/LPS O-acetylase OafA/YrhL
MTIYNKDYYKGLDGLRAIAVTIVMLFHFMNYGVLKLGWIGVDLFFVLSGFLITNILIKNLNYDNFFKNFYLRRAIRIFPIYFLVVIPFLMIDLFFFNNNFSIQHLSYIFYFQNFTALLYGYIPSLGHTWSLAIEEQFYLFFPLLLYFFRKRTLEVIIFLAVFAVFIRQFGLYINYHIYFQSTLFFTRMDSLLIGACLPLVVDRFKNISVSKMNRYLLYFLFITLALLILSISKYNLLNFYRLDFYSLLEDYGNNNLYKPYGSFKYLYLSIFFASIIGLLSYNTNPIASKIVHILELKLFKQIGKISYGIYIYHWCVHILLDGIIVRKIIVVENSLIILLIKIIITLSLAIISWYVIEKPLLKLKSRFTN